VELGPGDLVRDDLGHGEDFWIDLLSSIRNGAQYDLRLLTGHAVAVRTAVHGGDDTQRSQSIAEAASDLVGVVRPGRAVVEAPLLDQVVDHSLLFDGSDLTLKPRDTIHPPEY